VKICENYWILIDKSDVCPPQIGVKRTKRKFSHRIPDSRKGKINKMANFKNLLAIFGFLSVAPLMECQSYIEKIPLGEYEKPTMKVFQN
jgi:hypothetical protein